MRRRDVLRVGGGLAVGGVLAGGAVTRAAAQEGFDPLGQLPLPGAKELVAEEGTAYVVTTDGFATVDVSDPEEPTLLAERGPLLAEHSAGPLSAIFDGKLGGDYYAVAGPGYPGGDGPNAAVVFDVSDPADPQHVHTHETSFYHHNLDTDGETLYLCGNDGERNPLVCVDIESGSELGRWSVLDADERWADVHHQLRELHDVWVEDGVAYCSYWNAGTWLVDVSDPEEPTPVTSLRGLDPEAQAELEGAALRESRFVLPGNDHFAMPQRGVEGDLVALNEEAWAMEADAPASDLGGVELWDADAGERLARIEAPPTEDATYGGVWTTPHNFEFVGDRLYTSWYRGGVKVHDVSDPSDPEELAHFRETATTDFWTAQYAGDCVVASSWQDHSASESEASAVVYTFPTEGDPATATATGTDADGAGFGFLVGAAGLGAAAARRLLAEL